jgi:hypothetical protein
MFRLGHRRGKGKFLDTFGSDTGNARDRRKFVTIDRVASKLAEATPLEGFQDDTTQAILGDLLLCFCLENSKRALGRREQVQRVAPAQKGQHVEQNQDGDRTWFAVGRGFEENVLLKAFHQGMVRDGPLGERTADRFQEETPVGLDQLLMIRLAEVNFHVSILPDLIRPLAMAYDVFTLWRADYMQHYLRE